MQLNFLSKYILFFSLISFTCLAQEQKHIPFKETVDNIIQDTLRNNSTKINQLHTLLKQLDTTYSENKGYLYHKMGLIYYDDNAFKQAIKSTKQAIKQRESLKTVNYKKLNKSLSNVALYYNELNDFVNVKIYLEKIISNTSLNKYTYKAYLDLGLLYAEQGDYFKALEVYDTIVFIASKNQNFKVLIQSHLESLYVYSLLSNRIKYLSKIEYHKSEIDKWHKKLPRIDVSSMYNNLGIIYDELGKKEKALQFYNKAIVHYKKENDLIELGKVYINIAVIYAKNSNFKLANQWFAKGLNISDDNETRAIIYNNQGYYLQTKNPLEKIALHQKALYTSLGNKKYIDFATLPPISQLKKSPNKLNILDYLIDLAKTWVDVYENNTNKKYLYKAKECLFLVDKLVSHIRFESSEEKSKLFWINRGVNTYVLAVKVCYLLDDTESAFYFMEKNKSLLLLENLNELQAKTEAKIPSIILEREIFLNQKIVELEYKNNNNTKNESLLFLKKEQHLFMDSLKKRYPTYFRLKRKPQIWSLQHCIEKQVSSSSNFIEYILNKNQGYGIFCSKDKTHFFKISDIKLLLADIKKIKELCTKPFETKEEISTYHKLSERIFKRIFPFKNAFQTISDKKLIIVPDYQLQNFPFEALYIKSERAENKANYLIKNVEIAYLQSASVYTKINQRQRKSKNKLLGIAITTFKSDSLSPLQNSITDMKQITALYPSTLLIQNKATKHSFLSNMADYKILHLNTHAGIDIQSKEPWISFWDEKLYLKELYGQTIQADLVILDACKSATGTLEIGEGIMSLSRGFFHNGAKSVIATQWNANEKSNAEILYQFYKKIKKGKSKSQALYQAKLNYLNNHQLSETSPYFWASLVLIGDSDVITTTNTTYKIILILGFLILFLIYFIYQKRLK